MQYEPENLGLLIADCGLRIAPADCEEWFAAIAAEFDHFPVSELRQFAIGCISIVAKERVAFLSFFHTAALGLVIGGTLFWAALNICFARHLSAFYVGYPLSLHIGQLAGSRAFMHFESLYRRRLDQTRCETSAKSPGNCGCPWPLVAIRHRARPCNM